LVRGSWTVSSVDSDIDEALVDSARSEGPTGDTGYESDLVASDSSVFIVELASNAIPESSPFANMNKVSCTSFGAPVDNLLFTGVGLLSVSSTFEGEASVMGGGAISRFFRNSIAFNNRAFSGVIVGIFGNVAVFGEAADLIDTPELVVGRPPLV
jgi:hypothetical protein